MTNSASGGRASASIPRQGGNSAASLPVGHRAEATSPALTSLEVMGAGSSALDGEAPGEEGSPGYGCGRESTTQLEQIEETETDGGSVGDGSTTVQ